MEFAKNNAMGQIIYKEEAYAIQGALYAVHRELGCGFMERVYQEALVYEFQMRGIPYEREKEISIIYKGRIIGMPYRADFVCYGKILVELKSAQELTDIHRAQIINYLKVSKLKLGLLVNFGETSVITERFVNL